MRLRLLAFAIVAAACALVLWPPRPARNDLRMTFIDVGQGDAILVQTPRGHALMIDTGGKLERGPSEDGASAAEAAAARIVVPFLIRQGIHHVDAILLTHPHGDRKIVHAHTAEAMMTTRLKGIPSYDD
jgi:competence protein ComEC